MTYRYLTWIALLVSSTSVLRAQELPRAMDALKPGQIVRVRSSSGERLVSRVVGMHGDSLVLATNGASISVDPGAIDSVWNRGRATVLGAVIGAAGGAAISLGVSSYVCHSIREGFLCGESPRAVGWATAGSAVLGGAIGYAVRTWRLRYARGPVAELRFGNPSGAGVGVSVSFP